MILHKMKDSKGRQAQPVHGFFRLDVVREYKLATDSNVMMILHQLTDLILSNSLKREEKQGYVLFWYSIKYYSVSLAMGIQAMKRAFERMKKMGLLIFTYQPNSRTFQIALNVRMLSRLYDGGRLARSKRMSFDEINELFKEVFNAATFDEKRFLNMGMATRKDSMAVKKKINLPTTPKQRPTTAIKSTYKPMTPEEEATYDREIAEGVARAEAKQKAQEEVKPKKESFDEMMKRKRIEESAFQMQGGY